MISIYSFLSSVFGVLVLIGAIISVLALFDCIKRDRTSFKSIFTAEGQYDKFMWVVVILFSAKFFGVGAIAYHIFVRRRAQIAI